MGRLKAVISHIRADINRKIRWNAQYGGEILDFILKHLSSEEITPTLPSSVLTK
ncbi:unnamed protein product [Thelazia callipaeda]|uniref:DUF86 domain-containing protein n=1 Tax=Thelazia callipaeda TaxID=103827 RepID=A0A0N5CR42_THECL|nr:unnamed protein product [Thelazia callipaeda]